MNVRKEIYKMTKNEVAIKWNDKYVKINWPKSKKIISKKDLNGISIKLLKKLWEYGKFKLVIIELK